MFTTLTDSENKTFQILSDQFSRKTTNKIHLRLCSSMLTLQVVVGPGRSRGHADLVGMWVWRTSVGLSEINSSGRAVRRSLPTWL